MRVQGSWLPRPNGWAQVRSEGNRNRADGRPCADVGVRMGKGSGGGDPTLTPAMFSVCKSPRLACIDIAGCDMPLA